MPVDRPVLLGRASPDENPEQILSGIAVDAQEHNRGHRGRRARHCDRCPPQPTATGAAVIVHPPTLHMCYDLPMSTAIDGPNRLPELPLFDVSPWQTAHRPVGVATPRVRHTMGALPLLRDLEHQIHFGRDFEVLAPPLAHAGDIVSIPPPKRHVQSPKRQRLPLPSPSPAEIFSAALVCCSVSVPQADLVPLWVAEDGGRCPAAPLDLVRSGRARDQNWAEEGDSHLPGWLSSYASFATSSSAIFVKRAPPLGLERNPPAARRTRRSARVCWSFQPDPAQCRTGSFHQTFPSRGHSLPTIGMHGPV